MIKIMKYGEISNDEIFARAVPTANVSGIVADIIADVRKNGDAAVLAYNRKFDGCDLTALEVSEEEIQQAFQNMSRLQASFCLRMYVQKHRFLCLMRNILYMHRRLQWDSLS